MKFPTLDRLPDYPFDRLRVLLDPITPTTNADPIMLSIGEPRHDPPAFVLEALAANAADWNRYPPIDGTPDLRNAVVGWLTRRFGLNADSIDANRHVLPCVGTREALFMIATLVRDAADRPTNAAMAFPNPFYHVYAGAAVLNGFDPIALSSPVETGFLPNLASLSEADWARTQLLYICNPGNPQGAVASLDYLKDALTKARETNTLLIVDECYADLYDTDPPCGALQAAEALGPGPSGDVFEGLLIFHSVSKRSSAPGLRSGFMAGDAAIIDVLRRYRNYGGSTMPMPIQAASAALWNDDDHAAANRDLYRAKFDLCESMLAGQFGFYRPTGGFFLWLDVGDGITAAETLWRDAALRVLPGSYLGRPEPDGTDLSAPYIRIALVHPIEIIDDALARFVKVL